VVVPGNGPAEPASVGSLPADPSIRRTPAGHVWWRRSGAPDREVRSGAPLAP
jgi:hypothetical protein